MLSELYSRGYTTLIYLTLSPSCAVLGRSIVVYGSGAQSGQILACANIEPSLVAEEEIEISFPRNGTSPEDIDKVLLSMQIEYTI